MAWLTISSTTVALLYTCLGYLVRIAYNHRRRINELRKQGVPMPKEWSWITGHLLVLQKYVDGIPPDANELHPDLAAYRPFEQGPRNWIGQTLVWNELPVSVILTCKDLEIRDTYEDFDAKRESELNVVEKTKRMLLGQPIKIVHGERAYQMDSGGLYPANGNPCYVKLANHD